MTKITKVLANIIFLVLIKGSFSDKTVDVEIEQGVVRGQVETTWLEDKEYYTFRGIPYAIAPVKKLRFQPPITHSGWNDTLEAFEQKPTCMQFSARMRMDEPFGISGSEDCLFINIFTPNITGSLPVVIFDYNDSFKTGFNGTKTYSPDNFIDEDVIVVTISHRLGLFGYLTTEDDVIPGNNGLRDFILGLEWVRSNIKNFGGDAEKVTLMGSVGGGALVNILLYSKKAKGLFSAAIIQSGSAHETLWFYDDSRANAFKLGEKVNINTDDSATLLEELQLVEAETLFKKVVYVLENTDSRQSKQISAEPFTPVVEKENPDAVLTVLPGNGTIVNDVPVIMGFNSREGLDFGSHFLFQPKLLSYYVQEHMLQFPVRVDYRFERDSEIYKEANQEIVSYYIGETLDYKTGIEYTTYMGDVILIYPLTDAVKYISKNIESPVFFYMFDFRGQLNENSQYISRHSVYNNQLYGATILDELCYLHVCSRIRKYYEQMKELPSEQPEQKVLKRMVRMWTNFAKTRNPTLSGDEILKGFSWEPVSKTGDLNYLHVTKKLQMKKNPLGDRAEFWDNFLKKYASLSVDGVVKGREKHNEL